MTMAEAHPTRATYTGLFRDPNTDIEPLAPISRTHWHAFVVQVLTAHTHQPVRRVPGRTRSATSANTNPGNTKTDENAHAYRVSTAKGKAPVSITGASDASGRPNSFASGAGTGLASNGSAASGVLGTRKRAALGDLTNAARTRSTASALGKDEKADDPKKPVLRSRTAAAAAIRSSAHSSHLPTSTRFGASAASSHGALTTTSSTVSSTAAPTRRIPRTREPEAMVIDDVNGSDKENMDVYVEPVDTRETKRVRMTENMESATAVDMASRERSTRTGAGAVLAPVGMDDAPAAARMTRVVPRAKDEGWEDLDKDDADDPLMVAEYVEEIFAYMRDIEIQCMPNGSYMDLQRDLNWHLRGVLADWLIETHAKFRLLPETLFLALNIVDRFLSMRTISLSKLQLVGVTALFIAAKYEEVLCPSIQNFLYVADGGYTDEEILRAERYMLKVLNFDLSYASPMNFLRRISKADNYDIQTRTVAKYFMEISLVDHRLLDHPPSLVAAAAVWLAREVLERGEWTPTLVHYSTYAEPELLGTAEIMLDYCLRPPAHLHFHKKYSSKKFMRASAYVMEWAKNTFPHAVITQDDVTVGKWTDEHGEKHALDMLRVDLYERHGHPRPSVLPLGPSSSDVESPSQSPQAQEADAAYSATR